MPREMNRSFALLLMFFAHAAFAASFSLAGQPIDSAGLTQTQARQVLVMVLKHEKFKISRPGVFIDGDLTTPDGKPPHPGYYDFSVGSDSPSAGATEYLGLFSVSAATGDVWEINLCRRYIFPDLSVAQKAIMKRTGKTFESEKPERRGLGCTDE